MTQTAADQPAIPELVFAQASPRSLGGVSLFESSPVSAGDAAAMTSEQPVIRDAAAQLRAAGFSVLQVSSTTINIAGPPALYEQAFECRLMAEERVTRKAQSPDDTATFVECPDTDLPGLISTSGTAFSSLLEGVGIEEPRYYFSANPLPPSDSYWHLDVPGGVSLAANADLAHRDGITGKGITVVMTDSGHYAHPYFAARGYRVGPVVLGPGAVAPERDESGHGTAESANIFAVAPDVNFTMVKMSFVNTIGAFNAAVGLVPDVISCSWGSDKQKGPLSAADLAASAAVAVAVASGIIVVFSAGNGHFGFPGQHPDVICAGGTYLGHDGSMQASDYASGFASTIYPGRNVPDLTGLVGMKPRAAYIMLPVEPGDTLDTELGNGKPFPDGDQTRPSDGWAALSGTSAAAPQLAGAAALVKQTAPHLTPAEVRDVLRSTARPVTAGRCFDRPGMDHPAGAVPDLATGAGLVDAHRAVLSARLWADHHESETSPIF
ncbi:MAG TPA: S8 family serine peptidase [Kineosporiaceae bacterium]|nr:S8 family serine peptidase [Kineosporiaceae bacterium]